MQINGRELNLITPGKEKSIFDPSSAFCKELELYKLRSEIKPRKVNMMQAQVGMIDDLIEEQIRTKIFTGFK